MEEIKESLRQVSRAVFGNPDDPKKQPGIMRELADVESAVRITNETLSEMRRDQKKLLWLVLTALVGALCKALFHLL